MLLCLSSAKNNQKGQSGASNCTLTLLKWISLELRANACRRYCFFCFVGTLSERVLLIYCHFTFKWLVFCCQSCFRLAGINAANMRNSSS